MTTWVGIDPGKGGALVKLSQNTPLLYSTPIIKVGKSGREYDLKAMFDLLKGSDFVCIEQQGARPGLAANALSSIMLGFGYWEMAIAAQEISYRKVAPNKWKKYFGVTKDKNSSIVKAKELFPGVNLKPTERSKKDSADFAEALLLAVYCRDHFSF